MSVRCAVCSAEYPSKKGFHRRPVGKGRLALLCPSCCTRQAESAFIWALVTLAIMTVLGIALFHAITCGPALLFFAVFFLTLILSMPFHELGHALAALAVGMRLFTVNIGSRGRVLFVWRVFGFDVVFHRILRGGSVICCPKHLCCVRVRNAVTVLAGPSVHGLLVVAALGVLSETSREGMLYCALGGFIYGSLLELALNLLPRKVWIGNDRVPNDGLQLLTAPFMREKSIKEWHSTSFFYEALDSLEQGDLPDAERWLAKGIEAYPENSWEPLVRADILNREHRYGEARDAYVAALSQPGLPTETQAYLRNNVAWVSLMIADPALLAEADLYSCQALEEFPWVSQFKGTRGSVLIELGRVGNGIPLVEQAFSENSLPRDKALNACYLAIGAKRMGNECGALAYIEEARRHDCDCPLVDRVVRELEERQQDWRCIEAAEGRNET